MVGIFSIYLSLSLSMSLSISAYLCLSLSLSIYIILPISIYLPLSIYICLPIFIYLSIYLSLSKKQKGRIPTPPPVFCQLASGPDLVAAPTTSPLLKDPVDQDVEKVKLKLDYTPDSVGWGVWSSKLKILVPYTGLTWIMLFSLKTIRCVISSKGTELLVWPGYVV